MVGSCPALYPQGEFLRPLLAIVDCHAQTVGSLGYQALAAPGSLVALLLGASLTIFVAFVGYRFLFGDVPDARSGVIAAVKVGVVLTLATSWPTFRALIYDTTMHGPAEVASALTSPAALPGSGGGLTARLQGLDGMLAELQLIGAGRPPNSQPVFGPTQPLSAEQQQEELQRIDDATARPRWNPETDQKMLGQARTVFLAGVIGAYASVRLLAGLLLALGPLFAPFLLFDATRGLFAGWVRGLAATALGAVLTAVILGVQLALMEPWLAGVLGTRRAFISTPDVPIQLLVLNLGFVVVLFAGLVLAVRLARGFHLGERASLLAPSFAARVRRSNSFRNVPLSEETPGVAFYERPRAVAIADAVAASTRRELRVVLPIAPTQLTPARDDFVAEANNGGAAPPMRQNSKRRVQGRTSGGSQRRDRS